MEEPLVFVTTPLTVHPDTRDIEVVERKGRGHPDSICDALAETFAIGLATAYQERLGVILHHNVDKVLLAAGASVPRFGGGEVTAPFEVFLAGRASREARGHAIPVEDIAERATREWLRDNMHALDPVRHVRLHTLVRPGSGELTALVAAGAQGTVALANDTSFAVGYAPSSRLERMVLASEQALTSAATIAAHPAIGEDVKVMGIRRGGGVDVTVATAMIDRYLRGPADYAEAKAAVARIVETAAREAAPDLEVRITVNAADEIETGRIYLTVTGTSAEAGDDGQTGRGNRVGGLITPCRPMTMEAAAGKNVVAHVGKSYSIVAHQIAADIVAQCPEVADVTSLLVSRIGWPVDRPHLVELQVRTRDRSSPEAIRPRAEAIAYDRLHGLAGIATLIVGRRPVEAASWPGVLLF
jgi:S-adenosylmethionine synthetase